MSFNYSAIDQRISIEFYVGKKVYLLTNRGIDNASTALTWDVSQTGKPKKVMSLEFNPKRGLDMATAKGAAGGSFQPTSEAELQKIFSEMIDAAIRSVPTNARPDLTGSVILGIIAQAMTDAELSADTVRANATAKMGDLTSEDYTNAILKIESEALSCIPAQAKLEVVEILASKGIELTSEQMLSIGITQDALTANHSPLTLEETETLTEQPVAEVPTQEDTTTEQLTDQDLAEIKEVQQAVIETLTAKPKRQKGTKEQQTQTVATTDA